MSLFDQLFGKFWRREKDIPDELNMDRYPEEAYQPGYKPSGPHPRVIKIVVPDEYSKEQILRAFEHIHYCNVDTGFMAVNELVHIYQHPELIVVEKSGPPGPE